MFFREGEDGETGSSNCRHFVPTILLDRRTVVEDLILQSYVGYGGRTFFVSLCPVIRLYDRPWDGGGRSGVKE